MSDWLLCNLIKLLGALFRRLPLEWALAIGARLGPLAYLVNPKRKAIGYANLKAALGQDYSPQELRAILRRAAEHFGRSFVEVLRIPSVDRAYVQRYITQQGMEKMDRALAKGHGGIFVTAHFGNWELSSIAVALMGYPTHILVRDQKHRRLNRLLTRYRESTGCKVVSKGVAVREVIRALKANRLVAILGDQDAGRSGLFVKFFGRYASVNPGPFAFARATGCALFPSFGIRNTGPYHQIEIGDPLEVPKTEHEERDLLIAAQQYMAVLEGVIRRYPEQWLWLHKRWKSTPNRSILILSDGKPGHLNQAIAVAQILKEAYHARMGSGHDIGVRPQHGRQVLEGPDPGTLVSTEVLDVRYKSRRHRTIVSLLSALASRRWQGRPGLIQWGLTLSSADQALKAYGDVVISCGAACAPVACLLAKELAAKSVTIMRPGWPPLSRFDLAILPQHDRPRGRRRNVVLTLGAPNLIRPELLKEATERLRRQVPLSKAVQIGVLIGGDNERYTLSPEVAETVFQQLSQVCDALHGELLVTTSRRTSPAVEAVVQRYGHDTSRCPLLVIANQMNPDGVVPGILGLSQVVVVSGESVSMVSEAVSAGKYCVVFTPSPRTPAANKYQQMLSQLATDGYLKLVRPEGLAKAILDLWAIRPPVKILRDRETIRRAIMSMV